MLTRKKVLELIRDGLVTVEGAEQLLDIIVEGEKSPNNNNHENKDFFREFYKNLDKLKRATDIEWDYKPQSQPCMLDNLPADLTGVPLCLYCPCPKCSPRCSTF